MSEIDAFDFKSVFQQFSDYTVKRVDYLVNNEDKNPGRDGEKITLAQQELLVKVTNHFKTNDVGVLKIDRDEFALHLLLPYYMQERNVLVLCSAQPRSTHFLDVINGQDAENESIYARMGLITNNGAKLYCPSIIPQDHTNLFQSFGFEMIVASSKLQRGDGPITDFDFADYGEDRFTFVMIDDLVRHKGHEVSWDKVMNVFPKSKRLFLTGLKDKVDESFEKYLIK